MKRHESRGGHMLQQMSLPFYILYLVAKISPAWLAVTVGSALLSVAAPLCNIQMFRMLLDGLLTGGSRDYLLLLSLLTAGFNCLFEMGKRCLAAAQGVFSERFRDDFKCLAGERIMAMDYAMLESPAVMDLKERALRPIIDYGMLEQTLKETIPGILSSLILLSATAVIAVRSFPVLVAALFAVAAINLFLMEWVRKVKGETWQVVAPVERRIGTYNSLVSDCSLGKDIRIFGMDGLLMDKLRRLNREDLKAVSDQFDRISRGSGLSALLCRLQLLAVYGILAVWAIRGGISVADYVFHTGIFLNLGTALSGITDKMSELLYAGRFFSAFREFEKIPIREKEEKNDAESPGGCGLQPESFAGGKAAAWRNTSAQPPEITIRNVSFTYPGTDAPVLKELTLTLHRGERVAVVGENGAGKTTLVRLLCGLYQPDAGEILFDGKKTTCGEKSAAVFQDFRLFAFSVRDNVTLGAAGAGDIGPYLGRAGLAEAVEALPEKEDTCLYKMFDKNGVELSGGNGQRLAIARAMYREKPLLILDEPTAALDPLAEEALFGQFREISDGRTALMISHRLSAALFCDRIVVLREGRIVEDGRHEELMTLENGIYRRMYETQAKYYRGGTGA